MVRSRKLRPLHPKTGLKDYLGLHLSQDKLDKHYKFNQFNQVFGVPKTGFFSYARNDFQNMSFSAIYVKNHKKMKRKKRVKIDDFALASYKTFRVREFVEKKQKSVHETIFRAPLLFHHFCHITNSTEIYFVWGLKTKSLYV